MIDFSNASTTYGQSFPLLCDEGYVTDDGASIECLANGLWNLSGKCEIVGEKRRLFMSDVGVCCISNV